MIDFWRAAGDPPLGGFSLFKKENCILFLALLWMMTRFPVITFFPPPLKTSSSLEELAGLPCKIVCLIFFQVGPRVASLSFFGRLSGGS